MLDAFPRTEWPRLGPADAGIRLSAREFACAVFEEPFRYERVNRLKMGALVLRLEDRKYTDLPLAAQDEYSTALPGFVLPLSIVLTP